MAHGCKMVWLILLRGMTPQTIILEQVEIQVMTFYVNIDTSVCEETP